MDSNCKDCFYYKEVKEELKRLQITYDEVKSDVKDHDGRLRAVETKVDDIREDIREIKDHQSKTTFFILGTLGTGIVSLILLVFNIVSK